MSDKKIIATNKAPAAIGTYSQAVQAGDTLYLSGQIPLIPETMEIIEGGIEPQIEQVFENLQSVLSEANGDFSNIVKLNIFLTDLSHFSLVNEKMGNRFEQPYPARAAIGVKELPKGSLVEMDAIAVI